MTKTPALSDIQALMDEYCADWINQLDLRLTGIREDGADFLWRANDGICRGVDDGPKIVCGQAIMAVADTATMLMIAGMNGKFVNCTTVDSSTNFLRPLFAGDVGVTLTALSFGRKLVTARAEFRQAGSSKLAANTTSVFAYI